MASPHRISPKLWGQTLLADGTVLCQAKDLPKNHEYFFYQDRLNHNVSAVPSHGVIEKHQKLFRTDYRGESKQNPVEALRDRTVDNTSIGRIPQV